jgi:hypothetical protein
MHPPRLRCALHHCRSKTRLGSSNSYPATTFLGDGYFSTNATINPMMANWNKVVPCTV